MSSSPKPAMSSAPGTDPAPATASMRRVFVRNLILPWSIGVYTHERDQAQRVRINVDLEAGNDTAPLDDDIRNVVSYEHIVSGIGALAADGHISLVETLAERIGALCLEDPRVLLVRIRVEKLDVYDDAESVGIEVEYRQPVA